MYASSLTDGGSWLEVCAVKVEGGDVGEEFVSKGVTSPGEHTVQVANGVLGGRWMSVEWGFSKRSTH